MTQNEMEIPITTQAKIVIPSLGETGVILTSGSTVTLARMEFDCPSRADFMRSARTAR